MFFKLPVSEISEIDDHKSVGAELLFQIQGVLIISDCDNSSEL